MWEENKNMWEENMWKKYKKNTKEYYNEYYNTNDYIKHYWSSYEIKEETIVERKARLKAKERERKINIILGE